MYSITSLSIPHSLSIFISPFYLLLKSIDWCPPLAVRSWVDAGRASSGHRGSCLPITLAHPCIAMLHFIRSNYAGLKEIHLRLLNHSLNDLSSPLAGVYLALLYVAGILMFPMFPKYTTL